MSDRDRRLIERYTAGERTNHWIVAMLFVLAALSGLSLFHPALFWLSNFFGGGTWTRILHPIIGLIMFVRFPGGERSGKTIGCRTAIGNGCGR